MGQSQYARKDSDTCSIKIYSLVIYFSTFCKYWIITNLTSVNLLIIKYFLKGDTVDGISEFCKG